MSRVSLTGLGWLARRSALRTLRRPTAFYPAVLYPVLLIVLFAGGLNLATRVAGFPTGTYLAFLVAGGFVQGALVGGVNSGVDLATDIQTRFLERLTVTPASPVVVVIGQLCGSAVLAVLQTGACLLVALAAGVRPAAGGVAAVLALTVLMSIAFSACGALLAIRTSSSEAVLATFPITFVLLLFSSFFMPRSLMTSDWFRAVADWNPVSHLIEAVRSALGSDMDAGTVSIGFLIASALAALALLGTTSALRARSQ